MRMLIIAILALLIIVPAAAAQALPGHEPLQFAAADPYPGDSPDDALSPEKRDVTRRKIEALRIWRMTEALGLDAATSAKLASLLGSLDQQKSRIQREQMESMRSLRHLMKETKPDEAKIKALLDSLEKHHRTMQDLRSREISDLKGILTVEQQARYLLFQQEFMREMRGMIEDARSMGPGRSNGRMRGGPGGTPQER